MFKYLFKLIVCSHKPLQLLSPLSIYTHTHVHVCVFIISLKQRFLIFQMTFSSHRRS